ncbi:MAG: DUF456 domain-containing protein [Desulfovibrio sp.]|jgi:uncharacterized protein YqgC (DUF456 family)|nr:DUF456 domain-containing protein [Desulfovibrio sp.]
MDFLPLPLATLFAGAFLTLLGFILVLNVFGLPANWILLGLTFLWRLAHPLAPGFDIWFWAGMVGLALLGEALEFAVLAVKAKRHGSSSAGTFAGMIGAIAGAIYLAPLFFGLGALIGALIGAWTGCFVMEFAFKRRPFPEAATAAFGAMVGRFLGTVCKCGAGGAMLAFAAGRIWPSVPAGPGDGLETVMALPLILPG